MHLNDEALRAYLDHELDDAGAAAGHLAACPACRARLDALGVDAAWVGAHLAALSPGPDEAAPSAQVAYAQFVARHGQKEKETMFSRLFSARLRPIWAGLAVVLVLVVALSFQPVRALASSVLSQFRVKQVVVLPVDNTRLSALSGDTPLARQMSQLLSDEVKVIKQPGKPQAVASAQLADQTAGFKVRLPGSRSDAPQLSVQSDGSFQFKVNRARAQGLLRDAGFPNTQLPASIDGALIKVDVPAAVTAAYGTCPKLDSETRGSRGRTMMNCVILSQMPSPKVDAPPNLDIQALAEIGLQFTGMSPQEAHQYSQSVDWTTTMVVPVPRNGASYQTVPVDGVTGQLIQRPLDDAPQYALVWVKNGIIYVVGGLGNDTIPPRTWRTR